MDKETANQKSTLNQALKSITNMGYCIASKKLTHQEQVLGYMYREEPDNDSDSGWRFLSGDEDQLFIDNPDNLGIYDLKTIVELDPEIISLLDSDYGVAYGRNTKGLWEQEDFELDS